MSLEQFDKRITKLIGRLPASFAGPFRLLELLTAPIVWMVILLAIFLAERSDVTVKDLALCALLVVPLSSFLKLAIRRQRPPTIYAKAMKVKSYSFPSSHAYSAAVAGGYIAMLAFASDHVVIGLTMVALVAVVGLSRVFVGAHYPSDVLAGWLLGAGVLWMVVALYSAEWLTF